MTEPLTIKLGRGERILAVVPENVSGPGWSNQVVWVHIVQTADNSLRTECIQPPERTEGMHHLFAPAAKMHEELLRVVPHVTANAEAQVSSASAASGTSPGAPC